MYGGVASWTGHLLNFLYPPQCAVCSDRFGLETGHRVCARCLARVEKIPEPICSICGGPRQTAALKETTARVKQFLDDAFYSLDGKSAERAAQSLIELMNRDKSPVSTAASTTTANPES